MGASRRGIDRRLSRAVTPLPPVASTDPGWLLPAVSVTYAAAIALILLSADQLTQYLPGNWFETLGFGVLAIATLTLIVLLRHAWLRHREHLGRQALLALAGAVAATLLGAVAIIGLVANAQVASVISGADVHLTKPVMDSLPVPPGTKILDETPGIQGTESISEDMAPPRLSEVVPFYEQALAARGWVEDKTSATTAIVRFSKGDFILSVATDPPSGDYTLTVDRVTPAPSPTPSATGSPSASPTGAASATASPS